MTIMNVAWVAVGVFALFLYAGSIAFPHTMASGFHYEEACCSDDDCKELHDGEVHVVKDGYVWRGDLFKVTDKRLRTSPDGKFHGCMYWEMDEEYRPCLYVPGALG